MAVVVTIPPRQQEVRDARGLPGIGRGDIHEAADRGADLVEGECADEGAALRLHGAYPVLSGGSCHAIRMGRASRPGRSSRRPPRRARRHRR